MHKLISFFKAHKNTLLILTIVLLISGIAQGYNMFHFPYYDSDEGTYMSQAWSLVTQGKLSPYTYFYDHAPAGWLLIAIWTTLTGGFFTFGFSINTGRVLMLVLHLASVVLLFGITKKLTKSNLTAIFVTLLFSLTPLGIFFQRRVLLDNIMTFWTLAAFYLILGKEKKLSHYIWSSIFLGIATLSKEPAVFFLPPFLYILYDTVHKHHKVVAILKYVIVYSLLITIYLLYALLKDELFPSGTLLGGTTQHVSLLSSFAWQASRNHVFFLSQGSPFMLSLKDWYARDSLLIFAGGISILLNIIFAIRSKIFRYISLINIFFVLFLIRGGEIISFYITPFIPFLALSIGCSLYKIGEIFEFITHTKYSKYTPLILFFLGTIFSYISYNKSFIQLYTKDQTSGQVNAVNWVKKNIPSSAIVVIDDYAFVDLDKKITNTIYVPRGAQWYWKIEADPEVKEDVLNNNWSKLNYILVTDQMLQDLNNPSTHFELVKQAYQHSKDLKTFPGDGWTVTLRKVDYTLSQIQASWSYYSSKFIKTNGASADLQSGKVTSEAQSYALLRAVWMNDKKTYDKVLSWTLSNLKDDNNLFAWEYGKKQNGSLGILDKGTATDADEDIALSLFLASEKWHDPTYLSTAKKLINAIWNYETVSVQGNRYIVAGDWASPLTNTTYTMNPSYIAPYAYRIFAQVDTNHDWNNVLNSSYKVLAACTTDHLSLSGRGVLPPDWCSVDKNNHIRVTKNINGVTTNYSFDAMRVFWRLALDYNWYKDSRDKSYLQNLSILEDQFQKSGEIYDCYSHQGVNCSKSESLAEYGALLPALNLVNSNLANQIDNRKVLPLWKTSGYWGNSSDYYDQNWVWFGKALYDNLLTK